MLSSFIVNDLKYIIKQKSERWELISSVICVSGAPELPGVGFTGEMRESLVHCVANAVGPTKKPNQGQYRMGSD